MKNCCHIVLYVFLTGLIQPLNAQSVDPRQQPPRNRFDSLNQVMENTPDDTIKIDRLILLSTFQSDGGKDRSQISTAYAYQALALAEKLKYGKWIALAYRAIASVYQDRTEYKTAVEFYKQALDRAEKDGFTYTDEFYPPLLNLYFYLGDYPNAMETISREMAVAEKIGDKKKIAHCNNILGYIHFKQENFEKSENYYRLYLRNATEMNDSSLIAHALGEGADVFIQEKKYTEAITSLNEVLAISKAMAAYPGKPGDGQTRGFALQFISKAMYRLGMVYRLKRELPKAREYALEAINGAKVESPPGYDLARYYINAGDVYKEQKEYTRAIEYLDYAFGLSKRINHRENIRDAAGSLSETYAGLKKFDSAYYYHRIYTGLKDSIVNNETKMKIAGIQGQYDVAKKDKEIAKQEQIRNILIGSFLFLLIVLLLLYNRYHLKQKNRYQQEHNRQQNELFNAIVNTQDQERKRIAQDLHDSLGSVLSAAKLKLSALESSQPGFSPEQQETYQSSLELLNEAVAELRLISHNIMPATLSKLGLVAALQNLIDKISSKSGIQFSFSAHGFESRLDENTEISIYRITLELINNIVKHAAAKKASVQLINYPGYMNLVVEDNGQGFDSGKALREKKGIGLGNIISRVEYLKGSIEIDSSAGKGSTVIIEIPNKPAAA